MADGIGALDSRVFRSVIAPTVGLIPLLMLPLRGFDIGSLTVAEIYLSLTILGCAITFLGTGAFLGNIKPATLRVLLWGGGFWVTLVIAVLLETVVQTGRNLSSEQKFSLLKPLGSVLWLAFLTEADWLRRSVTRFFIIAAFFITSITIVFWVISGFPIPFEGFSSRKNDFGVGLAAIFLVSWMFMSREQGIMWVAGLGCMLFCCVLLYASQSRASQMIVIGGVSLYVVLGRLRYIGSGFSALIAVALFACLGVPIVFINQVSTLGRGATVGGREVFNGRERLWAQMIRDLDERFWCGYGEEFIVKTWDGIDLHAHNLFLGLLYHGGVVTLIAFFAFQIGLLSHLLGNVGNRERTVAFSGYLAFLLLNNSFEPTLLYLYTSYCAFLPVLGIALSSTDRASLSAFHSSRGLFDLS